MQQILHPHIVFSKQFLNFDLQTFLINFQKISLQVCLDNHILPCDKQVKTGLHVGSPRALNIISKNLS